ncbi:unnamed protein product [Ectocarpus sp. 8 AP-2014]
MKLNGKRLSAIHERCWKARRKSGVVSPLTSSWDAGKGTERVRYCRRTLVAERETEWMQYSTASEQRPWYGILCCRKQSSDRVKPSHTSAREAGPRTPCSTVSDMLPRCFPREPCLTASLLQNQEGM